MCHVKLKQMILKHFSDDGDEWTHCITRWELGGFSEDVV